MHTSRQRRGNRICSTEGRLTHASLGPSPHTSNIYWLKIISYKKQRYGLFGEKQKGCCWCFGHSPLTLFPRRESGQFVKTDQIGGIKGVGLLANLTQFPYLREMDSWEQCASDLHPWPTESLPVHLRRFIHNKTSAVSLVCLLIRLLVCNDTHVVQSAEPCKMVRVISAPRSA